MNNEIGPSADQPQKSGRKSGRDARLDRLRPSRSIKSAYNPRGGGINGGLIVLMPSRSDFEGLVNLLWLRGPSHWGVDAEQGLISEYFAGHTQTMPRCFNFQVHQLTLSAPRTEEGSEWRSLTLHPDEIKIIHYSAIPNQLPFGRFGLPISWVHARCFSRSR